MPPESSLDDVEMPWVAASYSMAAGVIYMLSAVQLLIESLYLGATVTALASVALLTFGLVIVLLGLDLLVNPFRHRGLGIAICIASGCAFAALVLSLSLATQGEYVLFVFPAGGIVAGVSAILYESPGIQ